MIESMPGELVVGLYSRDRNEHVPFNVRFLVDWRCKAPACVSDGTVSRL